LRCHGGPGFRVDNSISLAIQIDEVCVAAEMEFAAGAARIPPSTKVGSPNTWPVATSDDPLTKGGKDRDCLEFGVAHKAK